MDIILASASPRRQQLFRELGLPFRVVEPVGVTEQLDGLPPVSLALENAKRKACSVTALFPDALVIGADTLVVRGAQIFGKPSSLEEADAMLRELAGKRHEVITGVCLIHRPVDLELLFHEVTVVWMRPLTDAERQRYLGLINPLDKAGAYAIQEHGDRIIERIDGSYTNVVGLPIERLRASLEKLGLLKPSPRT